MKLYTLVFHLDGGELARVPGAGRVPEIGERPMVEDPISGSVGRFVVTGKIPAYVASNAHTDVTARMNGGGLTLVESPIVHVELSRVPAVDQVHDVERIPHPVGG